MVDVAEVETRTDLAKNASIEISNSVGPVLTVSVAELIRMAELYARSGVMVPPHCRDKPGTCFALCKQALDWGVPDLAVINKSYVVTNRGTERIAYESQLIHAVIEKNAPLKSRLRYEIMGNGDERRCKVWGTFRGEDKPHEYISETLGKLILARGRNAEGQVKGSPLWDKLPEVQMFYSASMQWARLFCPDVILGVYAPDEFGEPIDVTPPPDKVAALSQRLKDAKLNEVRGFDNADVVRQVGAIIEGDVTEAGDDGKASGVPRDNTGVEERQGGDRDSADDNRNQAASGQRGKPDKKVGAVSPADDPQADIFPPDRDEEKRKRKAGKRK